MPALTAGAAAVLMGGSLIGKLGQSFFSAREASKQRKFQERMSNTQYTRGVADMKNAGLNPVLAAGSPASSPSGAQGTISDPTSDLTNIASAYQQSKVQNAQADNLTENIDTQQTQQAVNSAQVLKTLADTKVSGQELKNKKTQLMKDASSNLLIRAQTSGVKAENQRKQVIGDAFSTIGEATELKKAKARIKKGKSNINNNMQRARDKNANAKHKVRQSIRKAKNTPRKKFKYKPYKGGGR